MVVRELHSPRIWAEQAGNGMKLSKVQTLTGQFSPIRVQALALWQPPLLWLYPSYMSWQTQRSLIMLTVFSGNRHRSDKISLINQLKISLIFVSVNLELTLKLRHTLLYDNIMEILCVPTSCITTDECHSSNQYLPKAWSCYWVGFISSYTIFCK